MNPKKVYAIDPAFIHRLGFNFSENKGRVLENIIFLELLRRGNEVYYYSGKYECDFLVKEGLQIVEAIQVVYTLDMTNFDREYNGLKEAMKNYGIKKGSIIINDMKLPQSKTIPDEIQITDAWKWLLSK